MLSPVETFTVNPRWLRDEANRIAQITPVEEQELAAKLMTPLMSDTERNISPSPPSRALSGPPEPLFGMTALNDGQQSLDEMVKPRSPNLPMRKTAPRTLYSDDISTPLLATNRGRSQSDSFALSQSSVSSRSSAGVSSTSQQQDENVPSSPKSKSNSENNANDMRSPTLSLTLSAGAIPSARRNTKSPRSPGSITSPMAGRGAESLCSRSQKIVVPNDDIHHLSQARGAFPDSIGEPDFVISGNAGLTRDVVFRSRTRSYNALIDGKLKFESWNAERRRGFWTLSDDLGDRWIVRYFPRGREYRAWKGLESGYDERGLAFKKRSKEGSPANGPASESKATEEPRKRQFMTGKILRKRNSDQIQPYTAERTKFMKSKSGEISEEPDSKSISQIDIDSTRNRYPVKEQSNQPRTERTDTSEITVPALVLPSLEKVHENTTLYVFISSDPDRPPGTTYLKSCRDIDAFFAHMPRVAEVDEDRVHQITAEFDWLQEPRRRTIRMVRGLDDSYNKMLEEVQGAPTWKDDAGKGKVNVYVNLLLKGVN